MLIQDRRRCRTPAVNEFRALLNASQLHSLANLEREGWRLRFVRRDASSALPVPVLATRDNEHAVLQPNGQLDDTATITIRG